MKPATLMAVTPMALAVALAACGREAPPPVPDRPALRRAVTTAAVERTGGAGTTAVAATVQARQRAALAARISATVVSLPFREGDRVAAGTVVARLDDMALRSALVAAEAGARAAGVDLSRVETLLEKGAATPREADESRARSAGAAAAAAAARDALAYTLLRAPFDGIVASRPASLGDVVPAGATIIEIEGRGGLEARATVDVDLVSRLQPGVSLAALVDGQPGALTATVRAVSASGDPVTHRFEVWADLPAALTLRSGVFARLLIPSGDGAPRLLVPATAVFQRGGLSGVFVVKDGTARLRWIATGATAGASTEVRSGVEAGERVALDPAGLVDGQPVAEAASGTP
jgi:membrane fusion protein, multidrug efflux system